MFRDHFGVMDEVRNGPYIPILSQLFSISFLCFKYMGQTWPSNRPVGSGTVYVLVLQKHKSHYSSLCHLGVICQSHPKQLVTFSSFCTPHKEWKCRNIHHRCQWEACRGGPRLRLEDSFPRHEADRLHFFSLSGKKRWQDDLLIVVDEEALHDENVDSFLLWVGFVCFRWQADAVRAGKLDWVLLPAFHSVDHSLHVQGSDHWYRTGGEERGCRLHHTCNQHSINQLT